MMFTGYVSDFIGGQLHFPYHENGSNKTPVTVVVVIVFVVMVQRTIIKCFRNYALDNEVFCYLKKILPNFFAIMYL